MCVVFGGLPRLEGGDAGRFITLGMGPEDANQDRAGQAKYHLTRP